jgi:hypothetical protein
MYSGMSTNRFYIQRLCILHFGVIWFSEHTVIISLNIFNKLTL